ncbi:hypothetical protein L227DRAFT_14256 [Lentinus tigrinus ALCF2SS1-6]|uniref:Uncharacterized protein n=1 Tax=Lentinus tigrinus ALCF2SS1-6 TaxID=1328759 RepID=A0A5C2T525_9APHY|nr:hypothetical protein L227DRAFT_14256 [Lentinus tigrinus ALCF2SS1-6]
MLSYLFLSHFCSCLTIFRHMPHSSRRSPQSRSSTSRTLVNCIIPRLVYVVLIPYAHLYCPYIWTPQMSGCCAMGARWRSQSHDENIRTFLCLDTCIHEYASSLR